MFVKTIVLDGFKSYGQRTEITGFDPQFNAITGLNGSGKSNILDAICFVLGISNLAHVRAGSLQELIFKSGQGPVNKATVSIVFDNSNADQCPPGFENCDEITVTRQIEIGGKFKYFVNGVIVTSKRIQDIFCSVQLNVNNPHFLIMQGKITKVLNMKPVEILSMIEEAAGTRMYETKRQIAQRHILRKDEKLKQLNSIMKEEVLPRLEKVRKERAQFLEYKRLERELEYKTGLYKAWNFINSKRAVETAAANLDKGEKKMEEIKQNIANKNEAIKQLDDEITELNKKAATTEDGGKLQESEAVLKEKEKVEAKIGAQVKSLKENINNEKKKKSNLEKNLQDDQNALIAKQNELDKVKNLFEKLQQNDADDNEAFAASQKRYEALCAGMEVNEEGEAQTLQEQLMAAEQDAMQANTEGKQANMQLTFCERELIEKQRNLNSNIAEYEQDKAKVDTVKKEVDALEKDLEKLNFSPDILDECINRRQVLIRESRSIKERVEVFEAQRPYTKFHYTDPEPNFNERRVDGVVCRLIKIRDPQFNVSIETAAGGKLYNVVVDSDKTVKKLLKNGNLQYRTTFIPLNKIKGRRMNEQVVRIAEELVGKENVQPAWAPIEYDQRLEVVIDYVFGNIFICKDLNVARQVAFHNRIKKVCVTLDGDVVDPSGSLSGGAPQKGGSVLSQLNQIIECEEKLKENQVETQKVEQQIQQLNKMHEKWVPLIRNLKLKLNELNINNERLGQSKYSQQLEEVAGLKEKIKNFKQVISECSEREKVLNEKIKNLQSKMKNYNKEKQLKSAEEEMNRLKEKADKSRKDWKQREQDYKSLNLEISELGEGLENIRQQIENTNELIIQLEQQLTEVNRKFDEVKEEIKEAQSVVKHEKSLIAEKNRTIKVRINKKEQLQAQITDLELEEKKQSHALNKLQDDYKNVKLKQHDLEKEVKSAKYLEDAQKLSVEDGQNLEQRIRNEQATKQKLGRVVNIKAQELVEQEEKLCADLNKNKRHVEADRNRLVKIIEDLDKKKENVLKVAHMQVSKDFGSIFSTLLPGANSKLVAPYGKTILDGLEIKVSLGNVWKDNLTELSGGQRSLAALALVLAMLLFKPAPLYILDEVDAALDLNHTQNIGHIIKNHFKKSQFIIVSLKDGMFNNANVLYRTRFVNGLSTITRTENQ